MANGRLDISVLPTVDGSSEQVTQLLLILLDNAVKFHAAGTPPQVWVSAEEKSTDWLFTVRDQGIGIDPQFHREVFKPFRRLHSDSDYPGVGMGLALAKKIIDHHGGRCWIESVPGEGTAFQFTLPRT